MKNKILLTFFGLMCCFYLHAQIPGTITYQGYLTDATGKPKSGTHKLTFNFSDGTNTVTRVISNVTVTNGLFTEVIGKDATGENATLPLNFWSKPITVKITVDSEAELPAVSLTTSPYAFTSQLANSVDGANITGTINASKIGGTLIASNIPSLDAGKITTGTISNALLDADLQDLADGSLSGGKVGTGISATNITTGTLAGSLVGSGVSASNVTTGTLSGSLVGSGVNAGNITGTLPGSQVGTGISGTNITTGTIPNSVLPSTISKSVLNASGYVTAVGGVYVGAATDPGGNLINDNYTQLGSPPSISPPAGFTVTSPLVKMEAITGTTASAQGSSVSIATGITGGKILSIDVMVDYATEDLIGPEYSGATGYQFNISFVNGTLYVRNSTSNSSNILSKPFKALIVYMQ